MKKIIILAALTILTAGQALAQTTAPTTGSDQSKSQSQVDQMHQGNGSLTGN